MGNAAGTEILIGGLALAAGVLLLTFFLGREAIRGTVAGTQAVSNSTALAGALPLLLA